MAGFSHLGVVDRWPVLSKRVGFSVFDRFLVIGG